MHSDTVSYLFHALAFWYSLAYNDIHWRYNPLLRKMAGELGLVIWATLSGDGQAFFGIRNTLLSA